MKKMVIFTLTVTLIFSVNIKFANADEAAIKVKSQLLGNASRLSAAMVIEILNEKRALTGLPVLSENSQLVLSAKKKIDDMIDNKYFAHESPDGNSIEYFGKLAGYDYILMAENLAYGDFKNEKALVEAWMESKTHRKNILNSKFTETGISISRGVMKGKETWLIVSHFGLPANACPRINNNLKVVIENKTKRIEELKKTLRVGEGRLAQVISAFRFYKAMNEYNSAVKETRVLIESYNSSVARYNDCIAQNR